MMGVPVYDERGTLFAPSIRAAAKRLRCHDRTVERHTADYRDGLQLVSRPVYAGQRGGGRWATPARIKARSIRVAIPPETERLYWRLSPERRRAVRRAITQAACELVLTAEDA